VINNVAVDVSDPEDGLFIPSHVRGYEHTSPATTPLTAESRDVLEIQYADLVDELSSDMTGLQSPVPVGDASQFAMDDIVMIANCEVADIFSVSGVSGNTLLHQTAATSGETMEFPNRSDSLSAWYTEDNYNGSKTEVFQFNRIKYYISHDHNADGDTDDPGEDVPALFRALNKTRDQIGEADELFMRGVDAFEVLYGEDTDGDTRPDAYVEADSVGTWGNITAVRFALLVRSENEYGSQADRSQDVIEDDTIDVLGTDFTAGEERVRRRLFQSTVFIRNSI
jgi:type IV pilus assembly protein PilW